MPFRCIEKSRLFVYIPVVLMDLSLPAKFSSEALSEFIITRFPFACFVVVVFLLYKNAENESLTN